MIYLDNSATTKPYSEVIDSFIKVAANYYGNPSSLHMLGSQAEKLLLQSRQKTANLLHVHPHEIVFTTGGSEGNNLAIKGAAFANRGRGRHIITTTIEHPSVSEACKQLEDFGFEVTYLPVNNEGRISLTDLKDSIREDTSLVSIIHVNNETGVLQPIEEIGNMLKNHPKVIFHVDHVQGIGKVPLDIKKSGVDICTLSAHKFNGLKGSGILFVREGISLTPLISGGEQEMKFRSGTENVAGIVSMTKALRLTLEKSHETINKITTIKEKLLSELSGIKNITINTPENGSAPHIINFSIDGFKSEVFVHLLEEDDVFVSTTSACSSKKHMPSKTLLAMGKGQKLANSAIRISLSGNNSIEEVPKIVSSIKKSLMKLERIMG